MALATKHAGKRCAVTALMIGERIQIMISDMLALDVIRGFSGNTILVVSRDGRWADISSFL